MANRVKEQEDLRHHVLESKTTLCLSLSVYIFRTLYLLFISFFLSFKLFYLPVVLPLISFSTLFSFKLSP